jgi:hypothetical protein
VPHETVQHTVAVHMVAEPVWQASLTRWPWRCALLCCSGAPDDVVDQECNEFGLLCEGASMAAQDSCSLRAG